MNDCPCKIADFEKKRQKEVNGMSEAEIQAAAHECMLFVVNTLQRKSLDVNNFNGTHPFEQCIRNGIEKANDNGEKDPLCVGFNVPDSTPDIQMMSVWSQALDFFMKSRSKRQKVRETMGSVRRKGVSKKKKRSPLAEHIGNQLLKCRQEKQLAMRKLAEISGLSVSFVCDLENGIMQPSAETIWRTRSVGTC